MIHRALIVAASLALVGVIVAVASRDGDSSFVRVISGRADAVSGDDALIELRVAADRKWSAHLNGRDVSASFRAAAEPGHLRALLTGLEPGKNILEVRSTGNTEIVLVNHPLSGPIFSGPQQTPFVCQNEANGLERALDEQCTAKTLVQYYYKSTESNHVSSVAGLEPGFKAYPSAGLAPTDVERIDTPDGQAVPYIVRRELGVINRAVYDIRMLHRPGEPLPTPWTKPTPGWNGRLVYLFDGGWGASYRQGILTVRDAEFFLERGYAIATSSLNVFGNESNDRIGAETLSMVKEHFSEEFGPPVHTIGWGISGGAMAQQLIAQNYPGLLDGLIVSFSFPDVLTTLSSATDCVLLDHAFKASQLPWSEAQKTAVSGFATWDTCVKSWGADPILDPTHCDASIPQALRYDRRTNPQGARCDLFGDQINVVGRDPRSGYANRALDNVGVQYGLAAFNSGLIDGEHFLDLNERVGGYDLEGNVVPVRMQASNDALDIAYRRGLVLTGGGGLSEVPIIDWRLYYDNEGNEHDRVRSLITRARLIAANGTADNQVIVVAPRGSPQKQLWADLLSQMERWLVAIAADDASGTRAQKVLRDKPADLSDYCVAGDGEIIVEPARYDGDGRCQRLYPPHANTRVAAGAPLTDDVLKCARHAVDASDYQQPLSAEQLRRLQTVFPLGVCDYRQPGVGQQLTREVWLRMDPR